MTDNGRYEMRNMVRNSNGKILAWREFIRKIRIEDVYMDGKLFLKDMRMLERRYGIRETFTYSSEMLNFEQFTVLVSETIQMIACSLGAVLIMTFLITASFRLSLFAFISVTLIELFLVA